MNQQIGANLNEAHMMLTTSIYDEHNKKIIAKISKEHKQNLTQPAKKSWCEWFCLCIMYPFNCCFGVTQEDETEVTHDLKYTNMPAPTPVKPNLNKEWVDTGTNAIPQDVFEDRLQAMLAIREKQDKEILQNSNQFDNFNKIREAEINEQFKQMQREKGY